MIDGPNAWADAGANQSEIENGEGVPPTASTNGAGTAAQSALKTAQQTPDLNTSEPDASGSVPQEPPTLYMRPVHTSPIARMVDKVADFLAGSTGTKLYEDQNGVKHVYHPQLPRGQQWAKIASEGIAGAAAGLAAGKGAGNAGKAALAGVQQGQQAAQQQRQNETDMTEEARQSVMDNANNQMLRMKMAEQAWRASRLQVEATQHDVDFSQGQEDRLTKEGGVTLGVAEHPGDIGQILKVNPDLMADMIKRHTIEIVPHVNPDGSRGGLKVIKMPQGYREQLLPPGQKFPTFNETTGEYEWHTTSDPETAGGLDDYWTNAGAHALDYKSKQSEIAARQGAEADRQANLKKIPSEVARNWAEANKANAETTEKQAATNPGGLVDEIGTGKMMVGRMAYLMARKPEILEQVAKKYPDFDGSKVESYAKTYEDFTSGKTATALNAGGTALGHLKELQDLNTTWSHVPHSPSWTAYQNKADTVATELAKFYGDATIPAIASIKDTLTSTLPGNRAKAIATQAQSMGDKLDSYEQQWRNAAPSAAYQAPMPQITDQAKAARAALDPAYKQRMSQMPGGGTVTVQIPGHPPGKIPAGALDKFKKDNPGAQVIQQ